MRSLRLDRQVHRPRRRADDRDTGRDVGGDAPPGADDRVVTDGDALQDDRSCADPDPIPNRDRPVYQRSTTDGMLIGVHDQRIPADLATTPDGDLVPRDHLDVAVQEGPVSDGQTRSPAYLEADAGGEQALARGRDASEVH